MSSSWLFSSPSSGRTMYCEQSMMKTVESFLEASKLATSSPRPRSSSISSMFSPSPSSFLSSSNYIPPKYYIRRAIVDLNPTGLQK
jgi:hypothetical protein